MPDSQDIDTAVLTKLSSDSTLLGYMPNNVWFDEAPPNSTRFVRITLIDENDDAIFGGRKFEDAQYLIIAVAKVQGTAAEQSAIATAVKNAAARIDALLEDTTLTVSGYTTFEVSRESRIRTTEVDDVDPTMRWYHRGGQYRVQMTLT